MSKPLDNHSIKHIITNNEKESKRFERQPEKVLPFCPCVSRETFGQSYFQTVSRTLAVSVPEKLALCFCRLNVKDNLKA